MTRFASTAIFSFLVLATFLVSGDSHPGGAFEPWPGVFYGPPPPITLQLLCAEDACVPENVKSQIRGAWKPETSAFYDECVQNPGGGQCTPTTLSRVNGCIYHKFLNATAFQPKGGPGQANDDFSYNQLMKCCGDSVTINMMKCATQPKFTRPSPGQPAPDQP